MGLVEIAEHQALQFPAPDRRDRAGDVGHRIGARGESNALVAGRQEVGVPHLEPVVRVPGRQDDERRQRQVERAQAVADPRPQAGHRDRDRAGQHAERRRRMAGRIAVDRLQEAKLVRHRADLVEKLADHLAAFAPGAERIRRAQQLLVSLDDRLVVVPLEHRLVVEGVQVRQATGHEEDDQVLGPRGEVAGPGGQRMPAAQLGGHRQPAVQAQAARDRRAGDAAGSPGQEITAMDRILGHDVSPLRSVWHGGFRMAGSKFRIPNSKFKINWWCPTLAERPGE